MAIRVTQVFLQVLHSGKTPQQAPIGDGSYTHNYNAFDGYADAGYLIDVGTALEGQVGQGNYFLAGFVQHDGAPVQGTHTINAYEQPQGITAQGNYSLDVYVENEQAVVTGRYQLSAFIELDDQHYGNNSLFAYESRDQVFQSEYSLQVYLLAQGYSNGLYDVEIFADLLMQVIGSYDLETYQQNENVVASGLYDLNALEAREAAIGAHFALFTFQELSGFIDSQAAIEVYELLEQKFGLAYDLNAYAQFDQFSDHSYAINVLSLSQAQIGAHYKLEIYELLNGFADATAVLDSYQPSDGFSDAQYGVNIYLAKTGFVDASYLLEALVGETGVVNGMYLLDTFQELHTWVVNQENGAPSRYEDFDFDAYAVIGQDYLAARGDGIYLLSGDDDAGTSIDAVATIGRTDFRAFYEGGEESVMKRVTACFLGLNSSGQAHLTLRTDQGITSGPYQLRQLPSASTTERAKFSRGLKSRYWEVDIANVDGGDLQIKSAELEVSLIGKNRRLKK